MVIAMQVGLIILTLILAIGITVYNQTDGRSQSRIGIRPVGAFVGAVLFIGAIFLSMAVGQIDSGSIGVVTRFGAVTGRTIEAGFYFVTPLVESVEVMDLQTRKYQEPWSAGSKDLQEVNTTVAVNYKLEPSRVAEV
jgi:regulator of protease activity HflC (stomatin/prohibitin superfamily)